MTQPVQQLVTIILQGQSTSYTMPITEAERLRREWSTTVDVRVGSYALQDGRTLTLRLDLVVGIVTTEPHMKRDQRHTTVRRSDELG